MPRHFRFVETIPLTDSQFAELSKPRRGVVREVANGDGTFSIVDDDSLFSSYLRKVTVEKSLDGTLECRQEIEVESSIPLIGDLIVRGLRGRLLSIASTIDSPPWLPPDALPERNLKELIRLFFLSIAVAYFTTLMGQTLTFAAREFGSSVHAQANALFASRLDIFVALPILMLTKRFGRNVTLRAMVVAGALLSASTALAPSLLALTTLQVFAKASTAVAGILVTILAAEKVPSRARAWSLAVLLIGTALGAGSCDVLLPIAGISNTSWRILYAISLPFGIIGYFAVRNLTDSQRYSVIVDRRIDFRAIDPKRLAIASMAAFLTNAFLIPSTQFRNEYLRNSRHFSAAAIGLFVILTNIPGALGLAIGGRFAETKGRRVVAILGIVVGGGGLALGFLTTGVSLWIWTIIGSACITAVVPSLGVYQTELFDTSSRSLGGGLVTLAARIGSILGIFFVGFYGQSHPLGNSLALLFIPMLLLIPILIFFFPETKGLELEEI
ncbi:MAG: hypothetical protein M0Z45_00700 [Actinomycetota bacterium]|nr:hypothetical protein [Actinomycetota bacterium]